ncbi:MAG: hypothetical protein KF833_11220 [Verrucomicrobiae bacterium]|nr:hypothetical protein [Verrucomicrobiae bacterium]
MKVSIRWLTGAVAGGVCLLAPVASGQWLTQSVTLQPGWNAVYLHVDASHVPIDDFMAGIPGHPIEEVWRWNPLAPTAQFTASPSVPSESGTPWSSWVRGLGASSSLTRLTGNGAYLVRVEAGSPAYTWSVLGRPVPPLDSWTTTGLNFIGFPTPPAGPPTFETFLAPAPVLWNSAEIFRYPGGPLGPSNPSQVLSLTGTPVRRGEAFWIRAGEHYNRYFGPIQIELQSPAGVHFGEATGQQRVRLRNLTRNVLTVTLSSVSSEAPPSGEAPVVAFPPLLLRGPLSTIDLTFGYTNLTGPQTWVLQPAGQLGSEEELILGLDRAEMAGAPGDLYAGVLRFTDSLGLSQVDVPVSAVTASRGGLWVGAAAVTQVRHYLRTYEKDDGGDLRLDEDGKYVVAAVKEDLGSVPRPYPLRLIVHLDPADGSARLLQRVYLGMKTDGTVGITTRESLLDPRHLSSARRISAVHLPWSASNLPWVFGGALAAGTNLTVTIPLDYADPASNPFVHGYHPDHDNLNATFDATVARGEESYTVNRRIELALSESADDFTSRTRGHSTIEGEYVETITLLGVTKPGRSAPESRQFEVRGLFSLNRISDPVPLTTD